MRVLVDGKPYQKERTDEFRRITGFLDSAQYGIAFTKETLCKKMKYKNVSSLRIILKRNGGKELVERYTYRASYSLTLWANPKTIMDLKNGKIQL